MENKNIIPHHTAFINNRKWKHFTEELLMARGNAIQNYVEETEKTVKGMGMPKSRFALQ